MRTPADCGRCGTGICCSGCKLDEIALKLANDNETVGYDSSQYVSSQTPSQKSGSDSNAQSSEASTDESTTDSAEERTDDSKTDSAEESTDESKTDSAEESTDESTTDSAEESTDESTEEVTEEDTDSSRYFTYEGISILMPEDYTTQRQDDGTVIATPKDFPARAENIVFGVIDEKVAKLTLKNVNDTYPETFEDFSGISVIDEYKVREYDAQKITYTIASNNIEMRQTQVIIYMDDKTVIINFTDKAALGINHGHEKAIRTIDIA